MQEMYTMSIDIHYLGVLALALIIALNALLLFKSSDLQKYAKSMRRLMPLSTSLLFLTLFTGTIMMAAKHLSFTLENIFMILFTIVYIVVEAYRYKLLRRTARDGFEAYKKSAYKMLLIEFVGTALITLWMTFGRLV